MCQHVCQANSIDLLCERAEATPRQHQMTKLFGTTAINMGAGTHACMRACAHACARRISDIGIWTGVRMQAA